MYFELYPKRHALRGRRWHWRLRGANHEIICSGQASGYANRIDAAKAIELVRRTGATTVLHEFA